MPRIPRQMIEAMVEHARAELPNEACGLIHATDGAAVAVHRVPNAAASPYRYEMEPMEQLRLERHRDEHDEELFAIYHSHVASEARPSPTDVRMAFFPPGELDADPAYPGTLYILVSLAEESPTVRAFQILRGGVVEEESIEVV